MSCDLCNRSFRSKASRDRAARYAAIVAEMRGGDPAPHLRALIDPGEPYTPRIVRHQADSNAFRQTGA